MFSLSALDLANSSFASQRAIISTKPSRRAASTCAGPMKPVPIIPALIVFIFYFSAQTPLSSNLFPFLRRRPTRAPQRIWPHRENQRELQYLSPRHSQNQTPYG